uniref:HMG box domain-containing protein n=1 Tax=Labrus bergylta TaxID=56723 RepID=A0A3Q3FQI7_9LABR
MRDYVPPKGFGKRGRKRKDPNAPKRPPSAFFVFCSEYRPSVKQQYPGLSIGDCAKKLGEMWSKLSQSEKLPYEEKGQCVLSEAASRSSHKQTNQRKKNETHQCYHDDRDKQTVNTDKS